MLAGGSFGLLGKSLGVLGCLRELIEGPWRVLGELLGFLDVQVMLGMPFRVFGRAWVTLMEPLGGL